MKKSLFLVAALAASFLSAQVLESEDFNSLTPGKISDTSATPGQGSWAWYGGDAADYNIAAIDAAHGNSATISMANTTTHFLYRSGLADAWSARANGNDFLIINLEIYTGSSVGATGSARSVIFNGAGSTMLGIGYDYAKKQVVGYLNATGTQGSGVYALSIPDTYPANTWIKVSYSFDKRTGTATFTTPSGTYSVPTSLQTNIAGMDPDEHDFLLVSSNTVARTAGFDNYKAQAASSSVLATKTLSLPSDALISVYPNPASDIININSQEKVESIAIFDATGRVVRTATNAKMVDVRSLAKGIYIIKVKTADGEKTTKFIKN